MPKISIAGQTARVAMTIALLAIALPFVATEAGAQAIRKGPRVVASKFLKKSLPASESTAAAESSAASPNPGAGPVAKAQAVVVSKEVAAAPANASVPGCAPGKACIVCFAGCPSGNAGIVHSQTVR